ncbi:MAG: hypothetical protein OEU92_26190 [Alphaproteobacteria bacterium]|nr:hypothetical protein [Alphaproteobacteria bacterium]
MRYILIENHSGYIWADQASHPELGKAIDVEDFCRAIDEGLGEHGRIYTQVPQLASNQTGYLVYRVGDELPEITDGQDQALIDLVTDVGEFIAKIHCSDEGQAEEV